MSDKKVHEISPSGLRPELEMFGRTDPLESLFTDPKSKELGIPKLFEGGYFAGLNGEDEQANTQLGLFIGKLQVAINEPHEGPVNARQSQVEAEIIGYLLGRKVAKNDEEYIPEALDINSPLLMSLNLVAKKACLQLLREHRGKGSPKPLPNIALESQRD